jgi:hypothetical protein
MKIEAVCSSNTLQHTWHHISEGHSFINHPCENIRLQCEIRLFLCLNKYHDMMMYGGVEIQLVFTLNGGEGRASRSGRFIAKESTR